jgi:hypothetical protein
LSQAILRSIQADPERYRASAAKVAGNSCCCRFILFLTPLTLLAFVVRYASATSVLSLLQSSLLPRGLLVFVVGQGVSTSEIIAIIP